ncbi:MAG: endonuclease/exonuclease/phosphatase family protein [Phycisphaerales bacterium]|nr:endonuclease/exonuclease/phosphatase family protein [Phycisphaerales bacterium]
MNSTLRRTLIVGGLLASLASADVPVRLATFNIENFSARPGSEQFEAAAAILRRVGADVVTLQEMNDEAAFIELAEATDYPHRAIASTSNAIDSLRRPAILSRYPIRTWRTFTARDLSGDPLARDLTRNFVVAEIDVADGAPPLVAISNHWQSANEDAQEFQRSIESLRAMQVTALHDSRSVPYFLGADMNADISEPSPTPLWFTSLPPGLPGTFRLGSDIAFPVRNSTFEPFLSGTGEQEIHRVEAFQLDGQYATHENRFRLDYLWRSAAVIVVGAEIYDSRDEDLGGGLAKYGAPLPPETSRTASDHLMVFADVRIPGQERAGACCLPNGSCASLLHGDCAAVGGVWHASESCSTVECPAPGACCIDDQTCLQLPEASCALWRGSFLGEGMDCRRACPCDKVRRLSARCSDSGTIKAVVRFVDESFNGTLIDIAIDGTPFPTPVVDGKAKLIAAPYQGAHEVTLVAPACDHTAHVVCP